MTSPSLVLTFVILCLHTRTSLGQGGSTPGIPCTVDMEFFDCKTPTTFLQCHHTFLVCECLVTSSYFDYIDSKCYVQEGGQCVTAVDKISCGPNSNCPQNETPRKCQCVPGFELTPSHKCAHPLDSPCQQPRDCDRDEYLTCTNLRCQCKVTAIVDPLTQKCVTRIGSSCGQPVDAPCPKNGTCVVHEGGQRFCECDPPFKVNVQGQCRVPFDDLCTATVECDETQFLICKTGFCQCDRGSEYNQEDKTCTILAGQECADPNISEQKCVHHASCQSTGSGSYHCMCDLTFTQSQGHCVRRYGQECDSGTLCDSQLFHECVGGRCACYRPDDSWYDPTTQNCTLLAGARCDDDLYPFAGMTCAKNSHCGPKTKICTCDENMVPNGDRLCVLGHGQLCRPNRDNCDPKQFLACDPVTVRCACAHPELTFWDNRAESCKTRAGQICNRPGLPECVMDSLCDSASPSGILFCKCDDDLLPSLFGKCVLPYGSPCTPGPYDQCNDEGYQRCQQNMCQCTDPMHMTHDPMDGICKLIWNSPCRPFTVPCQGNLTCSPENVCRCDESLNLIDNGEGQCLGGWGSSCHNGEDCSLTHFLTCVDSTCLCEASYTAVTLDNNVTTKCLGNQGVHCDTNDDCNTGASLSCNGGSCDCYIIDEQSYDLVEKKCYGNFHGRCDLIPFSPSSPGQIPLFCHPNYVCRPTGDTGDEDIGRCPAGKVSPGQFILGLVVGLGSWMMT